MLQGLRPRLNMVVVLVVLLCVINSVVVNVATYSLFTCM